MAKAITLHDMMTECQTWATYSDNELEAAKTSGITTANNPAFRGLVNNFAKGLYDDDIDLYCNEIRNFTYKEFRKIKESYYQ